MSSSSSSSSNLVLFCICIFLTLTLILPKLVVAEEGTTTTVTYDDDVSLRMELDLLESKLSLLESNVDEKIRELKTKDASIKQMEQIIQEKSATIASLQNDIKAVQEQGPLGADKKAATTHARIIELETQVTNLRKEAEKLYQKRDALESRASLSEKKVSELNSKLESLKKIMDEQKSRIRKTERALQMAEEEMMKAKLRETTVNKELKEAHGSWVPHWLSVHLFHCQSFILTQWEENGRPMLDAMVQKALRKKVEVEKWAEPHIDVVKTTWIPTLKEKSSRLVSQIRPQAKLLTAKTIKAYHDSKKSVAPHVVKLQKMVDPQYKKAKEFTKPYIDQVVTVTKPHVDNARVILKPYTKRISRTYRKFSKAVTSYHLQLQTMLREKLSEFELTRALATKEIVWFLATALMASPVVFLFKFVSSMFRLVSNSCLLNLFRQHLVLSNRYYFKELHFHFIITNSIFFIKILFDSYSRKPKRRTRNSHTSHTRRKAKRVHVEKRE